MSLSETPPRQTSTGFLRSFKAHPASVGESYFGHMRFALGSSARLFTLAAAALIHAFIPAWFETTASDQIKAMAKEMAERTSG